MTRSPDSLVSSAAEANLRAATEVNAVSASTTPPVSRPTQLELFPGRACVHKAKPATIRGIQRERNRIAGTVYRAAARRDGPSS